MRKLRGWLLPAGPAGSEAVLPVLSRSQIVLLPGAEGDGKRPGRQIRGSGSDDSNRTKLKGNHSSRSLFCSIQRNKPHIQGSLGQDRLSCFCFCLFLFFCLLPEQKLFFSALYQINNKKIKDCISSGLVSHRHPLINTTYLSLSSHVILYPACIF